MSVNRKVEINGIENLLDFRQVPFAIKQAVKAHLLIRLHAK
jgi:hypothetical protein